MEPVSLTVGIVALAGLFSTCVECFEYFKAGQELDEDLEILLVKLDLEKTRLLIWGNQIGILNTESHGRPFELEDSNKAELVWRCLERIKSLLSNTDKFQDSYGLQSSNNSTVYGRHNINMVSKNSMSVFKTSYRRFCARLSSGQSKSTLSLKIKWAIHDKAKFEGLVIHLREFIDGLNQVLPISRNTQDQIIQDDITSILDLSKLKLVRSACQGSYNSWSEIASTVIRESESGTIDRRNVEEWLAEAEGVVKDRDEDEDEDGKKITDTINYPASDPIFAEIPDLHQFGSIFFVLTESCSNVSPNSPCGINNFARSSGKIFNSILIKSRWSSIKKMVLETMLPGIPNHPNSTIYIYCPPCSSLISTASNICTDPGNRVHFNTYHVDFEFAVRPDDRLQASCCCGLESDRRSKLAAICEEMERIDVEGIENDAVWKTIDKQWLDQRIFELEELDTTPNLLRKGSAAGEIFSNHRNLRINTGITAGIIILGEAEHCIPIMQAKPFVAMPRIPRPREIFQMNKKDSPSGVYWARKFLGRFSQKSTKSDPSTTTPSSGFPKTFTPTMRDTSGTTSPTTDNI